MTSEEYSRQYIRNAHAAANFGQFTNGQNTPSRPAVMVIVVIVEKVMVFWTEMFA